MPPAPRSLHLVCNAHIDPVWLWEWEEGAAEAIGTFRAAADLAEEFDGFVFNHNEAVLYHWIGDYEPALLDRIRDLIRRGRWHVMGGWWLQPDCNLPSAESFVRQIVAGRRFFWDRLGVFPTTAMNFDSFGHNRGLVQILARAGYDSYLFCRPDRSWLELPAENFRWVGYDGSSVTALRTLTHYNTPLGGAAEKLREFLGRFGDRPLALFLWGVGNHGGGPSRQDLRDLAAEMAARRDTHAIRHSTPEAYFAELRAAGRRLPAWRRDIHPFAVGCYTTMARVKQAHRALENELFKTEKLAAAATAAGALAWPGDELAEAERDLLFAQFHDILPGSSVPPVEESSLRLIDHGREILSRVRAKAFFALARGQRRAAPGEIPVFVANPHPWPVDAVVACEFNLPDFNLGDTTSLATVRQDGSVVPAQVEKEVSNLPMDWRKRVVFRATLPPSGLSRFDCTLERVPAASVRLPVPRGRRIVHEAGGLRIAIDRQTGLIDSWRQDGRAVLRRGAGAVLVLEDSVDPWELRTRRFDRVAGRFTLASPAAAARIAGLGGRRLEPVRIIEDGEVRTVVEAIFTHGQSALVVHYALPKENGAVEVTLCVLWQEKDRMLKLALPTADATARALAQAPAGVGPLPGNGDEGVGQRWLAVVSDRAGWALTCINDGTHGASFARGELRPSLLRSTAHAAHYVENRFPLRTDRFTPRIDQGERVFRFRLQAGPAKERLAAVDREAAALNETPVALSFFPPGGGEAVPGGLALSDGVVQVHAVRRAFFGEGWMIRLWEPTGRARRTRVRWPAVGLDRALRLRPFELKTLVGGPGGEWRATDLLEDWRPPAAAVAAETVGADSGN